MKTILTVLFCVFVSHLIAQPTQTVRGTVLDSESDFPVFGAQVILTLSDSLKLKAMTNDDGVFEFLNVPVGKYPLLIKSSVYENYANSVEVNSGRQTVLEIKV